MPVIKSRAASSANDVEREKNMCCKSSCHDFGKKILLTLAGILLVYATVFIGTLIRNNLQKYYYIGQADRQERTIRVEATGKVTAKPDIAMTTLGMITEAKNVTEAQQKNNEVMNKLVAKLQTLGVGEKDIQTSNYNVYPQYKYDPKNGERSLTGYEVNQTVTVKIRELDKANQIMAIAGEVGVNNVGGLTFTFDDPEVYKAEARQLAIEKIATKVKDLSGALGVKFVDVYSYDERDGGALPNVYKEMAYGMGSGSPDLQPGSNDVVMTVGVTFEIR